MFCPFREGDSDEDWVSVFSPLDPVRHFPGWLTYFTNPFVVIDVGVTGSKIRC